MAYLLDDLCAFLDSSPTAWHATEQIGNRLALQDFTPLAEDERWSLEKGKSYFVIRGGSICAFSLPAKTPKEAMILASHTDSPALKIKPNPEVQKENMTLFGVEVYGAPLLSSWLNRDLAIAGRVVLSDNKGKLEERLVFLGDVPVFIPQLALHLDREVNEKGLLLNKQDHLFPVITLQNVEEKEKKTLELLLRRHLSFHSLLSFDLFLVPIEKSRYMGSEGEMIASYRLDNLSSAHACLSALALADKSHSKALQMAIFYDHEEIGSRSSEGAGSPFLSDVLKRIAHSYKMDDEDLACMKSRSLCVSVDVAHALNPNYSGKHDASHAPLLGKGVVLKFNADLKYATSALSSARLTQIAQKNSLHLQSFVSRNDIPSGATVGPLIAQGLGIPVVDIGCPELSMHSAREVIACQDYLDLCSLLTHLLQDKST
ncbi:MAG: M18 family aminopeptidase [Chlamydiales bacterium]|nr:M18 family aminopeptidase [Chlamydiales bacterium]